MKTLLLLIKKYIDEIASKITKEANETYQPKDTYLTNTDKTELQGNIDTVNTKVTTLVGTDTDKSVRTIANEELAKQLIPENASESLDTLTEIAAWIQQHPDDAAAINSRLAAVEGDYLKGADKTELQEKINNISLTPGKDGYTPIKGTDYWTDADKQEIIQDVINSFTNGDEVSY